MMQNMKRQISSTIDMVLVSFDKQLQLKSTCELMCDPIHLLTPKARVALLEYLNELIGKYMERGSPFNSKEVKQTVMKMFSWMSDQRVGQMITPFGEAVLCSLFALNAADFRNSSTSSTLTIAIGRIVFCRVMVIMETTSNTNSSNNNMHNLSTMFAPT
uniref:Uncharacterized protein n=3 Tax=Caenorhabditis japonica TaxID=281687 RepID=A0A8R1IEY6_CAEJA